MTDSLSPVQMSAKNVELGIQVIFSLGDRNVHTTITHINPENEHIIARVLQRVDNVLTQLGRDIAKSKADRLYRELDCYPNQRTDI